MSIGEKGRGEPDPAVLDPSKAQAKQAAGPESEKHRARADLSILARGSSFVIGGNLLNGVLRFAVAVVVARGLGATGAGALWVAGAVFGILSQVAELGADTGLVRMIPRYRALDRAHDIRPTLKIAFWPVLVVGAALGAAVFHFAPDLARLSIRRANFHMAVTFVRIAGIFLPLGALANVALAGTRGFGTMVPYVLVADAGSPASRLLLLPTAIYAGLGVWAIGLAWAIPLGLGAVAAVAFLLFLVAKTEQLQAGRARSLEQTLTFRELASEFWRFSAARSLAGPMQAALVSLDLILLGTLRSAREAAIYSAAGRFAFIGRFALNAVGLAIAPQIAHLLARGDNRRAETLFQTGTWWLIALSWPPAVAAAVYAPLVLRIFGRGFDAGQMALIVLSFATLFQMGTGNNKVVLLMGGKSSWNLGISAAALTVNVVLNLALIPHYGMSGAAVAWMIALIVDNGATTYAVHVLLRLRTVGPGYSLVAGAALGCYGIVGLISRLALGLSLGSLFLYLVVATGVYAGILWRFRERLHLPVLWEILRTRKRSENHWLGSYQNPYETL
jgi:O-antigen/teichoic acid export membrane protein